MKIIDILNRNEMSLSFEVFPPKVETSFDNVLSAAGKIAMLRPSFMSVTYGAGGGTSEYTLRLSKEIEQKYGVPMLAHLTCISSDKATVHDRIADLKSNGISNIMALRGDIPADMADVFMINKLQNLFLTFGDNPVVNTVGILATIMIMVSVVITVFSGVDYLVKNKDVLKLEDC